LRRRKSRHLPRNRLCFSPLEFCQQCWQNWTIHQRPFLWNCRGCAVAPIRRPRAHAMAMRQAAGQMPHGGDLRRRKCGSLRLNDCVAATWNFTVSDGKIGKCRRTPPFPGDELGTRHSADGIVPTAALEPLEVQQRWSQFATSSAKATAANDDQARDGPATRSRMRDHPGPLDLRRRKSPQTQHNRRLFSRL
jgi:hypothetical protein